MNIISCSFDENKLEYYIEWDDQDPSDRHVSIEHLAVNKSPYEDEIGKLHSFIFEILKKNGMVITWI